MNKEFNEINERIKYIKDEDYSTWINRVGKYLVDNSVGAFNRWQENMRKYENGELKIQIPKLPKGGIIDSATIAMIAEKGRQASIPQEQLEATKEQNELLRMIAFQIKESEKYHMTLKETIDNLVQRGTDIRESEYHVAEAGLPFEAYIDGPQYGQMDE